MKRGNLPPGHDSLLSSTGGTGSCICPVTQTRLNIPRSLITQSHRYGWTYQGLWLPSHTDMAGHTKAFDYPVTQTRLEIPRPLITQSHRHGWTYQGLWLPSRTDTAGHTKVFDYPVTQTRLDIPRSLITQSGGGVLLRGFEPPSEYVLLVSVLIPTDPSFEGPWNWNLTLLVEFVDLPPTSMAIWPGSSFLFSFLLLVEFK